MRPRYSRWSPRTVTPHVPELASWDGVSLSHFFTCFEFRVSTTPEILAPEPVSNLGRTLQEQPYKKRALHKTTSNTFSCFIATLFNYLPQVSSSTPQPTNSSSTIVISLDIVSSFFVAFFPAKPKTSSTTEILIALEPLFFFL